MYRNIKLISVVLLLMMPTASSIADEILWGRASGLSGTATMAVIAIGPNACAAAEVSVPALGILPTDVVSIGFQSDPSAVDGYGNSATDGLVIYAYPGTNVALFKVCNVTPAVCS